jgi:hypothetical protein
VGHTRRFTHGRILSCPRDIKLVRSDGESEPGSIPVGTIVEARRHGPRVLPRRLLFYFCELDTPRVILLVFLLVSAAIDG